MCYRYQDGIDEVERVKNRTKSRVVLQGETRLFVTCALVDLFLVRKRLLGTTAV